MSRAPTLIALAALLGVVVLFIRQNGELAELKKAAAAREPMPHAAAPAVQAPFEVAPHMSRIQAYAEKLWWAGQAGNLELASFYRHEMKEEMELVADAGLVDEGVPVSEQMKVYGIRAMDALKDQLATDGLKDFHARYESVISACNSCHLSTGHPELRMKIPEVNRFTGQEFTVQR